jgi:hypothetical protein
MLKNILIVFTFCILNLNCFAQASLTRTASAFVNISSYMALDLTSNGNIDFKFNDNAQLTNGIIFQNKFRARVETNRKWVLNVSSLTSNFLTIASDASTQMPPSILSLKVNSSNSFVPLLNTPSTLKSGSPGLSTINGNDFNIDIKATPGFDFPGGAYALVLLFTISPQ